MKFHTGSRVCEGRGSVLALDKVKFLNRRSATTVLSGELVAGNMPKSPDEKRDVSGVSRRLTRVSSLRLADLVLGFSVSEAFLLLSPFANASIIAQKPQNYSLGLERK